MAAIVNLLLTVISLTFNPLCALLVIDKFFLGQVYYYVAIDKV